MSTLYFIRHGQASFGQEVYDKLSELGMRQSRLLAEYLDTLDVRFDVLYSGTLTRHKETAHQYMEFQKQKRNPAPEIRYSAGLNEFNSREILGALIPALVERQPSLREHVDCLLSDRRSFQKVFEAAMTLWTSSDCGPFGIMSWKDFTAAVNGGIDEIMAADGRGRTIGVFTSGGPIAASVQRTLKIPNEEAMKLGQQLVNTSVTKFRCTHERIMITSFNEHAHLEIKNDKDLITYR